MLLEHFRYGQYGNIGCEISEGGIKNLIHFPLKENLFI